jgi:thiol-disulfide isomerase/thioredoxin
MRALRRDGPARRRPVRRSRQNRRQGPAWRVFQEIHPMTDVAVAPLDARALQRRALLMGLAMSAAFGSAAATPGEVLKGQALRDARMRGLNGPDRQLASFRGRPLIINVWASWCGPCVAEMASLERLAWHEMARRFAIIGISTDDYRERALGALKRTNATISHFIDFRLELEHMLGASSIPLTVLVDAQGRVLEKVVGAKEWDSVEALRFIGQAFGNAGAMKGR